MIYLIGIIYIYIFFRQVSKNEGEEYAKNEGILFFEVSAKTRENIFKMLYSGVAEIQAFSVEVDKEIFIKELEAENEGEHYSNNGNVPENNVIKNEIVVNGENKKVTKEYTLSVNGTALLPASIFSIVSSNVKISMVYPFRSINMRDTLPYFLIS